MAKKSKKGNKKASANPADALRDAVERTFTGAAGAGSGAQKRMSEVFDDFGTALVRLRETVDERRVIDTLETLRDEVAGLRQRVSNLELGGTPRGAAVREVGTAAARRGGPGRRRPPRRSGGRGRWTGSSAPRRRRRLCSPTAPGGG